MGAGPMPFAAPSLPVAAWHVAYDTALVLGRLGGGCTAPLRTGGCAASVLKFFSSPRTPLPVFALRVVTCLALLSGWFCGEPRRSRGNSTLVLGFGGA